MSSFSERYLRLSDGTSIGIFSDSKVFIILSPDGEYCSATMVDNKKHCLTRFCPILVAPYVKRTLDFRNRYTAAPYLCERFHGAGSKRYIGDKQLRWPVSAQINGSGTWIKINSHNRSGSVYLCPFGERVIYCGDALLHPDLVTEAGKTRISQPVTLATSLIQEFPCNRESTAMSLPDHIRDIVMLHINSNQDSQQSPPTGRALTAGGFISTSLVSSNECGARNADAAREIFRALEPELHLLLRRNNYPVGSDAAVVVEYVDGVTLVNTIGENAKQQIDVQVWFSSVSASTAPDSTAADTVGDTEKHVTSIHARCIDTDIHLSALLRQDCILTLSGDFFTLCFSPDTGTGLLSMESEDATYLQSSVPSSSSASASALTRGVGSGSAAPEALKRTFHVSLLEAALASASDEHLFDDQTNTASTSSISRSALSSPEANQDLLYLVTKYKNVAARLVQFREHVLSRRPSHYNITASKAQRKHLHNFLPSYSIPLSETSHPSSSASSGPHGGSYVIRHNELVPSDDGGNATYGSDGVVKLVTENGTKFSAYPMPPEEAHQGRWKCARLRGVFPDHTHLTVDILNKTVTHLSPNGSQDTWHLDSFLQRLQLGQGQSPMLFATQVVSPNALQLGNYADGEPYGRVYPPGSGHSLHANEVQHMSTLTRYFRELMTFLRFASAPPSQRGQVLSGIRRAAVVSAAAKARNKRHEDIRAIYEKAGVQNACSLVDSLRLGLETAITESATVNTTTVSVTSTSKQPSSVPAGLSIRPETSGIPRFQGEKYLLVHSAMKECSRVLDENMKILSMQPLG